MPLDLTGIQNVGEFYSHHYLDALLDKDLKGLFARWQAAESATPDKRLEGCAADYFKAKSRALNLHRPELRFTASHNIHVELLQALGYDYDLNIHYMADGSAVPTLSTIDRGGHPYLWLLETTFTDPDTTPLDNHLLKAQFPPTDEPIHSSTFNLHTFEDVVGQIFRQDQPPRWLILLAGRFIYLIDRAKWGQGQYLLFDLDEIFGRRQRTTLRATAALLSRDALSPVDGLPIHDTLDENSHKHAYGVSTDLKYGVRKAVELLANEYVWYQTNIGKKAVYSDEKLAQELTRECLTYLYRLLFLFYAEARSSELGLVPMQADAYRAGYSLEALRDLEQVPLNTPQAQNGYFLNESLNQLFKLVNEGYPKLNRQKSFVEAGQRQQYDDYGFTITGLQSPLFDREATPRLASAKLRNSVLQEVIQLLSLSRERKGRGKKNQRGRISYAQLGINQLGAVYEGLLSYTGFFAQETLYEVKPAKHTIGKEDPQTYFIPKSDLERYKEEEFVYETVDDDIRRRKRYPKGRFIFRLAGRDREKSASYYTPEVLTESVVKYSLKELLGEAPEDKNWKSADEILQLTICEPAMGSGAFINEAINQLADAYLQRKQAETGEQIPVDQYHLERQKVKAHLALHNAYGVDLNPMAAELAQVSIWLNMLYPGMPAPWFEARLAVGNSLIGARRQVYSAQDVLDGSYTNKAPEPVPLSQPRPKGSVYHWLLPDKGMAAFDKDKVIKQLAPNAVQAIKDWRKDFTKRINQAELKQMQALSDAADDLWRRHKRDRQTLLDRTRTPIELWGQPKDENSSLNPHHSSLSVNAKRKELSHSNSPTSPYRRLKMAMDYWCTLWYWPIMEVDNLPSRGDYLADLADLLIGPQHEFDRPLKQLNLMEVIGTRRQIHLSETSLVDVDQLSISNERLKITIETSNSVRYHHWELTFSGIFTKNQGFDLTLGNPPWVKLWWNERGILSEIDPRIAIRKTSASQIAKNREELLNISGKNSEYFNEYVEINGTLSFLNQQQNYPLLKGIQTNLYKCFISNSWLFGSPRGVIGLLHPEGVFDDPAGGLFRTNLYLRLSHVYRFSNVLMLFSDVMLWVSYCLCIYTTKKRMDVNFQYMANLFHPETINNSTKHDGQGFSPGIKDSNENWDLRGHKDRIIKVNDVILQLFAILYDKPGTNKLQARLPSIHSRQIVDVLQKLAKQSLHMGDIKEKYYSSRIWEETAAQNENIIRREIKYPDTTDEWIIAGPHFYVANPFYKTPNENCRNPRDYSEIDLTRIPDNFLPRTIYIPARNAKEYRDLLPKWRSEIITDSYRHVHRRRIFDAGERTLINAIAPPGAANLGSVFSINFETNHQLVRFSGLCSSLIFDFFVKSTGKGDMRDDLVILLPIPRNNHLLEFIVNRTLRLNCLTTHYASLWQELYEKEMNNDRWAKKDYRLSAWELLTDKWVANNAVRNPFERRQALVEIDVLSSLALDLTIEQHLTIYRIQFPVLQKNERRMLFDKHGLHVPTKTKRGQVVLDESHSDFPSMVPPFTPVDREADYRQAWAHFEKRLAAVKEPAPA